MKNIVVLLLLIFTVSCSSPQISDYTKTAPVFNFDTFFNGKLIAHGIVFDRDGKMTRRFTADMIATWEGETATIEEFFTYDDGEKSTRIWTINKISENQYSGSASDVVGTAYGETQGAAFHWQYDLLIPVDDEIYQINLDDWMYLLDSKRLFNKTNMTKFGLYVGEVNIIIEKQP